MRGKELVVAVDVAKHKQFAALAVRESSDGPMALSRVETVHFDLRDMDAFVEFVAALGPSKVVAILEPTGSYSDPVAYRFTRAGWSICYVRGKKTHDARELFDGVPSSHDAKSCALLLRLHEQGLSTPARPKSEEDRDAAAAVRTLHRLQDEMSRLRGQLEAMVARVWPELTRHLDLTRSSLAALLANFPGPEDVRANPEAAIDCLMKAGKSFLKEDKIKAIVATAESTFGVPMTAGEREALRLLAEDASSLHARLRVAKRGVEVYAEREASELTAVAGKATAVILRSQVGAASQYSSAKEYEKAFGLNLRHRSSGTKQGRLSISKRGSSIARRSLFFMALRLIKADDVVSAWYQKRKTRNGQVTLKAIVAVMRKLVRALWHLAQGAAFDATKLFDLRALRLHNSDRQEGRAVAM